ncbi:MAG: lipoate--protein ligase [Firmicutes bacterium]|nr:lipoate--protein ligase [Bacillota bacterium]
MINIINNSSDPRFNLALEEYALNELFPGEELAIIWQNEPTVVIGRNQNTIEEINEAYIKANGINVVRRLSGGGAVYHDFGNLNFTFIVPSQKNVVSNFEKFTKPVIMALQSLGVPAEFSGRNDITIEGKKFSGNAQYWSKDRLLHHGTILFNSDLSVVQEALQVRPEKLVSKGVKSVRSRVTNIYPYLETPLEIEEFKKILLRYMLQGDEHQNYELTSGDLRRIEGLIETRYSQWSWNYGHSPAFALEKSQRFPGGQLNLKLNVQQGLITEMGIYGDFFGRKDVQELARSLQGQPYEEDALRSFLTRLPFAEYFLAISLDEFLECLFH